MNSQVLWSIALGISFLGFALNAYWRNKTGKLNAASGFVLWQATDGWINYVLYPFMLGWLGAKWGFVTMFFLTLVGNIIYIKINNATETDWTLMQTFTGLPVIRSVVKWKIGRLNIGKAIGFVFLSIKFDSFYAINYLYGKKTDLRNAKVVILFLTSHVICNMAWTLFLEAALGFAKILLKSMNVF